MVLGYRVQGMSMTEADADFAVAPRAPSLGSLLPEALPWLSGWRIAAFRLIWFVALAGAVAGLGVSAWYNWQRDIVPAPSFAVFGLTYGLDVPLRLSPPLGREAVAAGVTKGDAIVAINGVAVSDRDYPPAIARLLDLAGGQARIGLRTPSGTVRTVVLSRSAGHAAEAFGGSGLTVRGRLAIVHIVDIAVAAGLLAAAVLMYARRSRDPVAAMLSLSLLLLLASYAWVFLAEHDGDMLVRTLRPTAWVLMTAVLFAFPSGRFDPRWTAAAVIALPLVWLLWVAAGLIVPVMILNFVFLALAVLAISRRGSSASALIERQQIKWAVFGFGTGAALIVAAMIVRYAIPQEFGPAAEVWAEAIVPVLLVAMIACFAAGLLVSLLRYRLYDADAVISRSATAAIVTLTLGAAFAATQKLCEVSFDEVFGHAAGTASAGVAAALAAIIVEPVHHRVRHWAEHRFQRGLLHLKRDLPLLVADLRETMSTQQLVDEVVGRVVRGVHACRCGFLLEQDGALTLVAAVNTNAAEVAEWRTRQHHDATVVKLECDRDDLLFPLRVPLRDSGYDAQAAFACILLGPRPDGSFYGADERTALAEIADPISRALLVARRRDAHEAEGHRAIADLGSRLGALEVLVASLLGPRARRA